MADNVTELAAITVTGEATASAPPDQAEVDGGVTTEGKTAREASAANAKAMSAVMAALKTAGIADKDMQTETLSIQPQYSHYQPKPGEASRTPQIVGYSVGNTVRVKLRDVTRVADVFDAMVSAGANTIGGVSFSIAEPSKLMDSARANAMADARRKAELYAKAVGATLGRPLAIVEGGLAPPPRPVLYKSRAMAAGSAEAMPVAPGEQTMTVSVSVTWELKSAP